MRRLLPIAHCATVGLALAPAPSRAEPVLFEGFDYYFGDFHTHTGLSRDGGSIDLECPWSGDCGEYATIFERARTTYELDFLAITDHGNGVHSVRAPAEWNTQLLDALDADDPGGGFVVVPGVEVWLWDADGEIRDHRNLYLFGGEQLLDGLTLQELIPDPDVAPFTTDDCSLIFAWLEDLEATRGPVLLIPHHPAVYPPGDTDWECVDPRYNPVVENYSEHGNSQTPSSEGSFDPPDPNAEQSGNTVDRALALDGHALQLGLIGGTDSHDTEPGSTCDLDPRFAHKQNYGGGLSVIAVPEGGPFDADAVLDALRERRTLSTSGPRVPVRFRLWADGAEWAAMGEDVEVDGDAELELTVEVPSADAPYVSAVELVWPWIGRAPMTEEAVGTFREGLSLAADERVVVYAVVEVDGATYWPDASVTCDDGGSSEAEYIWTSPIWITAIGGGDDDDSAAADDDDDCSCDQGGSAAGATPVMLLVLATMVRRSALLRALPAPLPRRRR